MKCNKLEHAISLLDRCIEFILFIIVIVMTCAGVAQIFFRYVLQSSLSWSEELMRYLYVWMTMIGVSLAIRRKQFTAIEAIYNLINAKSSFVGRVLQVTVVALQISFYFVLIQQGIILCQKNMDATSAAMQLSMGIAYLAIPIGSILGIIYCLISLWDLFKVVKTV